ncbi:MULTISPECIES: FliH/SctL family protein [unclassified Legionella]|uniref:FliH/SctL family protein n=1 Tax=unclassified Legionella TaxID=2622702 RepID=UPI001055274B|nr:MULTISPECIES: FliH/SctL family protein [unclassified Legionella]MDI9817658.1 FliH/SctL family protein [Legionella sp. PL877]
MDDSFQPWYEEKDQQAFNLWEFKVPETESIIEEVDPQEEFARECDRLREEAEKAGYQEGMKQAAEELQLKRQELANWLNLIRQPVALLDKNLSHELVQTIAWVCQACIGIELSIHPDKLSLFIEEIKKELPSLQGDKQLVMNPSDIEWLNNELEEQQLTELRSLFVTDETLERGDFYLRSEHNELDGRLKTRLQKILQIHFFQDEEIDKPDMLNQDDL